MKRVTINVNPLNNSNLSCIVKDGNESGASKLHPLDIAIADIDTLAVRRKGSQATNVASVRLIPLSAIHFIAPVFNIPPEAIEAFTKELVEEAEATGESLPEYVAIVSPPSSFIYYPAKIEGVRTPFHKLEDEEEGPEYKAKQQLKAYETPDTYMVPAFKSIGKAFAEAYLKVIEGNIVKHMAENKLFARIASFPVSRGEEHDIFSMPQPRIGVLMSHKELFEGLKNLDISEIEDKEKELEQVELRVGEDKIVITPDHFAGNDKSATASRWQAFLKALRLWSRRIKVLDEYRAELERGDGSPFDLIKALFEDSELASFLRGAFSRYPQFGIVDFQAGSGRHLKALNDELHAEATLLGVEYREIPPEERVGGENNKVQYGVDCLTFFPEWNASVSKGEKAPYSMIYYLNPPYMNDRTISMRSVTAIPEGALSIGLYSIKDEKLLRSNFRGYLVKIPAKMTGYEDPETPQYFLALIGYKVASGTGDVFFLDLEGQEDRFKDFEEVVEFLKKERPHTWEEIVNHAMGTVAELNNPNLRKHSRVEQAEELIGTIVQRLRTANLERWQERFESPEEALKTLSKVLSLDANAMRGERVFPDLRVVGAPKLLTIDEVLGNLHLLSFYRDAYPEWYEMAKRVASMMGKQFPDLGNAEEKEVIVSEHLGILKYKYLPKVLPITDEIKEVLVHIGIGKPMELMEKELAENKEEGDSSLKKHKREMFLRDMAEEYAKLKKLFENGHRLIVKTKMEAISVGGDASFGYTPVLAVEDEFGRHLGTISIPLATFYEELEKRGIVNPKDKYEVAEPDGELMAELVDRYISHVRATAREHLGIDEEKEERLKEALSKSKTFREFREEALVILSEGEEDFRFRTVDVFKTQVLAITDVREELISSLSSLLSSMGEKELLPVLGKVIEEVSRWYKEYPFIFLSTRTPEDIELYRERLTSEEEEEAFSSLPWVQDNLGSEDWVKALIDVEFQKADRANIPPDVVEDIKDTIFQTLSEHSALEEGVRQGAERFVIQYLYTYALEPLLSRAKAGDKKSGERLMKGMRNLFVNMLGVMPHQYDEAINLLAKKVRTGEKGHLLGWEMRSGKTLAMSLIGYFNALYSGKDVYMFPKTANMLDIIYQIATFTPQVAFNLRAYKSGDVELGLSEDRVSDVITSDVYPNIFAITHINKLLVGAGATAEMLLQDYAKDMEEIIGLYERKFREHGNEEEVFKEEIAKREEKPYSDILRMEGIKPTVRLALYDYFSYLEGRGLLKDLDETHNRQAMEALLKALRNLSTKLATVKDINNNNNEFFTFHLVPKYHLFAVQFRIPRGEKSIYAGGTTPVQISVNKDLYLGDEQEVTYEEFLENVRRELIRHTRPLESFGATGYNFLSAFLTEGVKVWLGNGGEAPSSNEPNLHMRLGDIAGVSFDEDFFDWEALVDDMIVQPVRMGLIDLLRDSETKEDKESEELTAFLERLLVEEDGLQEGEINPFFRFLHLGLGVASETIGEIKPTSAQGSSIALTTHYISFSFNEELEKMFAELGVSLSEENKKKVESAVNKALQDSGDMRKVIESAIRERRSRLPFFHRAYASVATPSIIHELTIALDPKNATTHKNNMESRMGLLYSKVHTRATEGSLLYNQPKAMSAELSLRLPSSIFGGGIPVPYMNVKTEKVGIEEGESQGEKIGAEVEEFGIRIKYLGRGSWLEGGEKKFTPYALGDSTTLTMHIKGRAKPAVFFGVNIDDPELPDVVEASASNATNYFVHSRFFKDKQPIAIIDEADESTNPNAKGYLAFYYISHNSELAVASTGTPTSGDVKTPVALIGLVSALPLDTIEQSVKRAIDDFAVFSIKEDKVVPYLLMTSLLQLNMSRDRDVFIPNLVQKLFNPILNGSMKDEEMVKKFISLLDSANRSADGSILDPTVDYQLEKIGSGDIPHHKVVSDLLRIVFNFNRWLKKEGKILEEIVYPPEVFRETLTSFFKERGVATLSPGTYDPIGFVSMLSNASLLTRETLKQAINPNIQETKNYKDLPVFLDMLKAQARGEMRAAFGDEDDLELYCTGPGMRYLWDITIGDYRSGLVLSEVFSFYINNLYQLVNAISKKPEPFLEKYMEKEKEKDNVQTLKDVLEQAEAIADPSYQAPRATIPKMSKQDFKSFMEKSSKTKDDSIMDVLKAYIVKNFSWEGLEEEFGKEKVAIARAIMDYFTKNFLMEVHGIWQQKKAWSERMNHEDKLGEESAFTCKLGDYTIIPYLTPVLFSEKIMINSVEPNGQICLFTSDPVKQISKEEGVTFSNKVEFYREEWGVLAKEDGSSFDFVLPYDLKFLVDEENEIIDMFTNKGLRDRIRELVENGKNFLVAPSRKKVMSFALLDVLSDLYFEQKRRRDEGEALPTYHVLVRVTDREHMKLIGKIDRQALEDLGIVLKVFHHHTELDMEAKKLKGIINREKAREENKTKMVVVAPAKTISRGVDFSMLDEMVVMGTLDGNGRDFAQLLARLYNNSNKHHAEISMFGTPIRLRRKNKDENELAVNYASLVQLRLLQKEEFIRAVMSGKIANILDRNSLHVGLEETRKKNNAESAEGREDWQREIDQSITELEAMRKEVGEKRETKSSPSNGQTLRNVSPSL